MTGVRTVAIGWPKSMWSFAQTYVVEIGGAAGPDAVWLGHLGKGVVANWADRGSDADAAFALENRLDNAALAAGRAGAAAGKRVLSKMEARLMERYREFDRAGRSALEDSRKTRALPGAAFTGLTLVDRSALTRNTPPALKTLAPPYLRCRVDGKEHTFFAPKGAGMTMKQLAAALRRAGAVDG